MIVQNTAPWTYLGDRAINPCPDASFDTGLDLMAMRALHVPGHGPGGDPDPVPQAPTRTVGRSLTLHDLAEFTLRAARPLAFQLDGDYLGERIKVTFTAVPDAVRVFC